jgi:transposase-like protein
MEGDKPKRQKFKRYPIGYFHIDIAELRTNEGKLYLFVAIDRTSKFTVVQLVEKTNRKTAWEFLETVLEAAPYKTHTILTDNAPNFVSSRATTTEISRGHEPTPQASSFSRFQAALRGSNDVWLRDG